MKVQNINYHTMINQHKPKYGLEESSMGADLCGNQSVGINTSVNKKQGYYNGSFTGKEKAAVSLSSRALEKLIDACNDHTSIVQALVALVLATGPRPLAILSLPGKKNKEDKIYASGHSMASGLIGFVFSSIIMSPLDAAAKRLREQNANVILGKIEKSNDVKYVARQLKELASKENLAPDDLRADKILEGTSQLDADFLKQFGEYEVDAEGKLTRLTSINKDIDFDKFYKEYNIKNLTKEKLFEGTKHIKEWNKDKFLKNFMEFDANGKFVQLNKSLDFDKVFKGINMLPDTLILGVVKAMLTIALIPPILKYVFGVEKRKPAVQPVQNQPSQVQKPEGGVK